PRWTGTVKTVLISKARATKSLRQSHAGPEPRQDCCIREFGSISDSQWYGMSSSLHGLGIDMFAETLSCPLPQAPGKYFRSRDSPGLLPAPLRNHKIMAMGSPPSSLFGGGGPWCL
ncbi:hypothetical protein COCVIDRAFT_90708, partial [Bipolaris victoriae FI3]